MEVKPGYKQTEVGVLPEDWEVKALPDVSWFQEGPGLRNWQFTSSGMKVINVTNLEDGVLNLDRTDRHISMIEFNRMYRHFAIDSQDIVMASSGNSYSKTAIVREQDLPLVMNTSVIRFKPSKLCDYGFLWALLTSPHFKSQIDLMITGGAQPNFGPYHLKKVLFSLPTLPEQRAIAEALSDVDGLLGGLDRLIAKKRDLKQAAMQQLLTGQTRLPGFHGEWEVNTVAELEKQKLVKLSRGQVISKKDIDNTPGDFPIYSSSIHNDGMFGRYGDFMFDEELITWSVDGGGNFFHRRKHKFSVTNVCGFMRVDTSRIDYRFFAAQLQLLHSRKSFDYQSKAHPSVVRKEYKVQLPPLAEQTAIAEVLSEMDGELGKLEERQEKTRALKQAMMQELLTGRTRLV